MLNRESKAQRMRSIHGLGGVGLEGLGALRQTTAGSARQQGIARYDATDAQLAAQINQFTGTDGPSQTLCAISTGTGQGTMRKNAVAQAIASITTGVNRGQLMNGSKKISASALTASDRAIIVGRARRYFYDQAKSAGGRDAIINTASSDYTQRPRASFCTIGS